MSRSNDSKAAVLHAGGEQWKRAKLPLQPYPYDAPYVGHGQVERDQSRDRGCSRTKAQSKSKSRRSKSRRHSKSKMSKSPWHSKGRRSKSRRCSKSRRSKSHRCEREVPDQSPGSSAQDVQDAGHSAFSNDLFKFRKLKDEVMNNSQSYIRRRAAVIFRTLSSNHEAVKCLSAFGDQAQKFAAEVLATIELGTQHRKLKEAFLVPVIPRWLQKMCSHRLRPRSEESCNSCP